MPPPYELHLFVCTNRRPEGASKPSCGHRGGDEIRAALKKAVAQHGLRATVRANSAGCLDVCEEGPAIVVYPQGVWYVGVTPEDVQEIVESHLLRGTPVSRLVRKAAMPVVG